MSDFTISIPHRSRAESLAVAASHAWHLSTDDDRAVSRQIVLDGMARNGAAATVGQLLDELAGMTPDQRRQLLDQARVEVGLPSATDVESREHLELLAQANRASIHSGLPTCHSADCPNVPMTSVGGFATVNVRRWFCPSHIGEAEAGDMEPRGHNLRYSPSGTLIEVDPREEARERERAESRRALLASQAADRAVEASERRASNQARDAAHRRELPEHFRQPAA